MVPRALKKYLIDDIILLQASLILRNALYKIQAKLVYDKLFCHISVRLYFYIFIAYISYKRDIIHMSTLYAIV